MLIGRWQRRWPGQLPDCARSELVGVGLVDAVSQPVVRVEEASEADLEMLQDHFLERSEAARESPA